MSLRPDVGPHSAILSSLHEQVAARLKSKDEITVIEKEILRLGKSSFGFGKFGEKYRNATTTLAQAKADQDTLDALTNLEHLTVERLGTDSWSANMTLHVEHSAIDKREVTLSLTPSKFNPNTLVHNVVENGRPVNPRVQDALVTDYRNIIILVANTLPIIEQQHNLAA